MSNLWSKLRRGVGRPHDDFFLSPLESIQNRLSPFLSEKMDSKFWKIFESVLANFLMEPYIRSSNKRVRHAVQNLHCN